ncbi:MAG: DNA repair protein RadC [Clostridiales bacterium]|nr:DNA repair protein RadC [Clostridiales bacterium]
MFMRELPVSERPREKMLAEGIAYLSSAELLAILLGTGTDDKSALNLAEEVLSLKESGILFLSECSPEELTKVRGIGAAKACRILAGVELGKRIATKPRGEKTKVCGPETIASLFMEEMRYCKKEIFNILLMNTKGEIIGTDIVSVGDLSGTVIHPREVFLPAVRRSAAAVAFVHNHPSGDPTPSNDDIKTTKKLVDAGKIIGIAVWDHIVIGDGKYVSFREEQLIQ